MVLFSLFPFLSLFLFFSFFFNSYILFITYYLLFITYYLLDKEESIPEPIVDEYGNLISFRINMYGKEWELIRYTIDGRPANCNSGELNRGIAYLGIQRRRTSGRLDHITEVKK